MESKLNARAMKVLRQQKAREDREAAREWIHEELQSKYGEQKKD